VDIIPAVTTVLQFIAPTGVVVVNGLGFLSKNFVANQFTDNSGAFGIVTDIADALHVAIAVAEEPTTSDPYLSVYVYALKYVCLLGHAFVMIDRCTSPPSDAADNERFVGGTMGLNQDNGALPVDGDEFVNFSSFIRRLTHCYFRFLYDSYAILTLVSYGDSLFEVNLTSANIALYSSRRRRDTPF
jgi:hypothetical protein